MFWDGALGKFKLSQKPAEADPHSALMVAEITKACVVILMLRDQEKNNLTQPNSGTKRDCWVRCPRAVIPVRGTAQYGDRR